MKYLSEALNMKHSGEAMKVIRNGTGWDITFDMVFTDQKAAAIIAARIAPLLPTLIRDAVDISMSAQACQGNAVEEKLSSTPAPTGSTWAKQQALQDRNAAKEVSTPSYPVASIVYRVRALNLSASLRSE